MEKSKVYFTSFKATGNENLLQKLHRLMRIWKSCVLTSELCKSGSRLCKGTWWKTIFNRL